MHKDSQKIDALCTVVYSKKGSHGANVTLFGTHVAFGGVRFATCHATILSGTQRYIAALNGCRSGVRTVRKIRFRINILKVLKNFIFHRVTTDCQRRIKYGKGSANNKVL